MICLVDLRCNIIIFVLKYIIRTSNTEIRSFMQQSYCQIIQACENALIDYDATRELLEYPEVQADKAYYLTVLKKFNELQQLHDKLSKLQCSIAEQEKLTQAMSTLNDDEKALAVEEIATLRKQSLLLADSIAEQLGCSNVTEEVYCRILCNENSSDYCEKLFELIKQDMLTHGAVPQDVKIVRKKGSVTEISFSATGRNVLQRLSVLSGVHKVLNTSMEVALAVTLAPSVVTLDEKDIKIDLFHSSGAGGQNINKVETAVRVTHLPTGTVVVCQDERSQLKNKRRALETLRARLSEQNAELEKKRIDTDILTQLKRVSVLSFNANGDFVDKVNGAEGNTPEQFSTYINSLLAKGN